MASDSGGLRGGARAEWLATDRDAAKMLESYLRVAEEAFKRRIQSAGINLTGEMLSSFRHHAAQAADGYVTARLDMAGHFRLKDLRSMHYSRTPPLDALEDYVETVGVGRFANVPGYKRGTFPANHRLAVERIAWGLKMKYKQFPNVKRSYRGIYSDPLLTDVLPYLFRDLSENAAITALKGARLLFND